MVAVKTEKYSKSKLHVEVEVLKAANATKTKHFCELIDFGLNKPDYEYVVMTLLFKDLHKLRSEMPDKRFTISTSLRLSMQSIKAIEKLHKLGYVSRDIKPGNFAPGHRCNKQSETIYLYDFGLSRKYIDRASDCISDLYNDSRWAAAEPCCLSSQTSLRLVWYLFTDRGRMDGMVLFQADAKWSAYFVNVFVTACLTRGKVYCKYAHAVAVSTVQTNNAVICIT
ncbi:hypothetical protein KIN20_031102 [Parelaphostrongylus tenuis]|uniref:Protein kinase domain-containing protein n=1 Tax=Parelaphostrongylus tenuis TaxID=148309 RepID=A0AAD5R4P1_PARTN|nr:hypothetical protein KIN20_031102 [Parelaphostrongylus tenuis]